MEPKIEIIDTVVCPCCGEVIEMAPVSEDDPIEVEYPEGMRLN